ncbi:MAG: hypothetical protein J5529_04805 [Prevotella sp.]|nr:hypothetical protein [Prevotella sp.]
MKNKNYFIIACAMVALLAFGACKKKEVDVNKLYKSFTESVVAEQSELGNTLSVDTIFLNQTTGDNFKGELRGHINDSTEVVYDLDVTDEGDDFELEWNLRN